MGLAPNNEEFYFEKNFKIDLPTVKNSASKLIQMKLMWNFASSLWRFIDQRDQLLIVSLHRIDHSHGISSSTVEKSLKLLADRYRFVLPEDLQQKEIKGKMAMLTVDDGYMEVYTILYPIIQSLKISMTVCATTDFVLRNHWLWFDKLLWIFRQSDCRQIQSYRLPDNIPISENEADLKKYLKTLQPNKRDELIESIARHCGIIIPPKPDVGFSSVKTADLAHMLESGTVELASHTVTHPILINLSDADLEFELQRSKQELEDFSGRSICSFCYPNGLPGDYDERTKLAVNKAGYSMAFSSREGINYKGNTDWSQLKRIHVSRALHIFKRNTSGLAEMLGGFK